MNNGKVRIYEISKELNLDNRDILAVCEQLGISVKSHSSSISDEEAAQIRAAAPRSTASIAASGPTHRDETQAAPASPKGISKPQPTDKKPPTIEIRRPASSPSTLSTPDLSAPGSGPSSESASPSPIVIPTEPMSPPRPPSTTTVKPVAAPAPTRIEPTPAQKPVSPQPASPQPASQPAPRPESSKPASPRPESTKPDSPKPESIRPAVKPAAKSESAKPSIVKPMAKPEAKLEVKPEPKPEMRPDAARSETSKPPRPTPEMKAPAPKPVIKPVAKPQATEMRLDTPKAAPAAGATPRPAAGSKPMVKTAPKPEVKRPLEIRPVSPPPPKKPEMRAVTPRPPAGDRPVLDRAPGGERAPGDRPMAPRPAGPARVFDPNRPAPPVRPGARPEPGAAPTATPPNSPNLELRRPTDRPAPAGTAPRRGKSWEEEDEEEKARKLAAKNAAKPKRRVHIIDEDDDEVLAGDGEGLDEEATQLGIAISRPPKPKAMQAAPKPAAPTSTPSRRRSDRERRNDRRERNQNRDQKQEKPEIISIIGGMTVQDLAAELMVPETDIIRSLFFKGIAATITQTLDVPTIEMVCEEVGVLVEKMEQQSEAKKVTEVLDAEDLDNLQLRPPVVTVMGHVDHGKTTLLDSIRKTKVAAGEAGGITQHIGAYHVDVEHGGVTQKVVFLDTPGHEAFTAMRARGTRVTDIAILVVAADDGVRPQTIEAISHAKAAEVPIIVAINKIDKEGAQPERVKQELTEYGLVAEEWGGNTSMVSVSALTGLNIDSLLEMILLVSEVGELSANPNRPARGTIIEANLDKARGPVATFLVQNGTLRVGDVLVAGAVLGKVRAMIDDRGRRVSEAGPSFAVEVLGLGDVPAAGEEFEVYTDEKLARATANERADRQRASRLQQAMASRRVTLTSLSDRAKEGELKDLNLVIKADVQGSLEAILSSLERLPQGEVQVRVLLSAPGEVTETDVDLAAASGAVIIGFNTSLASGAKRAADAVGVDIREYDIIYNLLEDVQGAMEGLLEPELVEEYLGQVEVRAVFAVGRGSVAGCYVQNGKAVRNCSIRVKRGNEIVHKGNLDSLRRVKEDTKEVAQGFECGISLDNFNSWEEGDIIEAFKMVTKRRILAMK
jgi:translation initiation factor IF-2